MSPREKWPELWHFFDVLHQDWDVEFADKDECMAAWTRQATDTQLQTALAQWDDAFDGATDGEVAETVKTFNPWWDADTLFGGARQWADWVRQHLERELGRRNVSG